MMTGLMALIVAALFSGAAIYITIAEQPARLKLNDQALLDQWKPSYKRGYAMQASLALAGFLLGAASWYQFGHIFWLCGALVMLSNWPYTLLVIRPLNNRLMTTTNASAETRALIIKWSYLHAVRSVLGFLAVATFLLALC